MTYIYDPNLNMVSTDIDFLDTPFQLPPSRYKGFNVRIKKCGDLFTYQFYKHNQYRLDPNVEDARIKLAIRSYVKKKSNPLARSLNRTRQTMFDLVACNKDIFKSFVTLSFSEKDTITKFGQHYPACPYRFSLKECNKRLNIWITNIKRYFPNFKYLGVYEKQESGAIHYHMFTNFDFAGYCVDLPIKKHNSYKYVVRHTTLKSWIYGYSDCLLLSDTDDNFDVCKYMCVYMNKKHLEYYEPNARRILCSHGLNRPKISYAFFDDFSCDEIYNMLLSMYERIESTAKGYINRIAYNVCYATFTELQLDGSKAKGVYV